MKYPKNFEDHYEYIEDLTYKLSQSVLEYNECFVRFYKEMANIKANRSPQIEEIKKHIQKVREGLE